MQALTFIKWMTVVGGFLSYFLADGCTFSAGVIFSEFKDIFQATSTEASLLPALAYAIPQFMSLFVCPLADVVGYSTAAAWGAFFLCISFIVTSLAQEITLTYFVYGVLLPLGLQLTYSSALMSVVFTFKGSKWLGFACGAMVCGGGIGAFAANHFLIWILYFWTWREALILLSAIFLHAWVSAAIFYWLDETAAILRDSEVRQPFPEIQFTESAITQSPVGDSSSPNVVTTQPVIPVYRRAVIRLKGLCYVCPIFMILMPSRYRPRSQKYDYTKMQSKKASGEKMTELCYRLRTSFSQFLSPKIWTNAPFLIYILTNALASAGVVIPWTFVYDYVCSQWTADLDPDSDFVSAMKTQIAWYPGLIGLGSSAGQILVGLLISKLYDSSQKSKAVLSNLIYLFGVILMLNGGVTLGYAFAPVPSYQNMGGEGGNGEALIFSTTDGCVFAAICFCVGITDGALMALLGPILEHHLDEANFPVGLSICLCLTGAFNLAGTLTGGYLHDALGFHHKANLLAACLPFAALVILLAFCLIFCRKKGSSEDFETSTA